MGKIRIILSRFIPFVWFAKLKDLHRNYRKRKRSVKTSEKASYIRRLQLLIRRLKAGKKDVRIPESSVKQKSPDSFSRKTIQGNTASSGNSRDDDDDEEKSMSVRCEIGNIKEVHLPEGRKWNVLATSKNETAVKKIVLRKRGDGRIESSRSSSNPESKDNCYTPGQFGSDAKNYKVEGVASDLFSYRLSVSSVEFSAETNDYDWDRDLASFASASSFTRSLEDESSISKQTKERSIEQISDAQTSDSVSQAAKSTDVVCLTSRQNNDSVDHDDRTSIVLSKSAKKKRSRGARRRAPQATGSERTRKIEPHSKFCNRMVDNGWCSSILESTSKGWNDGYSCSNLKPFEKVSHQRLRSSCATNGSPLRRSYWKPEDKLASAFRPRLASVCGCAQRDRSWKETELTEVLVKRKVTRRNREIMASKFIDEIHYANKESPTVSKVRNSVPVVKCSFDPYEELRVSMVEMIVKKELHETQDLDELLRCYLSLNPPSYHDLIVKTFKDVWQEILKHPLW